MTAVPFPRPPRKEIKARVCGRRMSMPVEPVDPVCVEGMMWHMALVLGDRVEVPVTVSSTTLRIILQHVASLLVERGDLQASDEGATT